MTVQESPENSLKCSPATLKASGWAVKQEDHQKRGGAQIAVTADRKVVMLHTHTYTHTHRVNRRRTEFN